MPSTYIGTSGWQHDTFAGRFYPDDVAQDDWLGYYAGTFGTVEVNNTFYQSPEADTLRAWRHFFGPSRWHNDFCSILPKHVKPKINSS